MRLVGSSSNNGEYGYSMDAVGLDGWLRTGIHAKVPGLSGGHFEGGSVIFVDEKGDELSPIGIPSGTLVMVDNEDGTWSVG